MRNHWKFSLWRNWTAAGAILFGAVFFECAQVAGPIDPRLLQNVGLQSRKPLVAVTFAENRFVAVGEQGSILTSENGETWVQQNSGITSDLSGVSQGDNQFVAVGKSGAIVTSPEGKNWTRRNSRVSANLNAVAYGNGLFVAVGDGTVLTSTNALNWAVRNAGTLVRLSSVAYGNGLFVAVGGTNILTSPDGMNWARTSPDPVIQLTSTAFGNGTFLVGGYGFTPVLTSVDGKVWTRWNTPTAGSLSAVTYGNAQFVAVGRGSLVLSSRDGVVLTWQATDARQYLTLTGVAYGNGRYVAVGDPLLFKLPIIMNSADGIHWDFVPPSVNWSAYWGFLSGITWGKSKFVVVGSTRLVDNSFNQKFPAIVNSPDGLNWTPKYPGVMEATPRQISYGGGRFVTVGQRYGAEVGTSDVAFSPDAENWTTLTVSEPLWGIGYGNGSFVAVGPAGVILTSPDGMGWTRRESGTANSLWTCAYLNDRYVALGELGTILTSRDAVAWARIDSGTTNWLRGAAFGNGAYVVVGQGGVILISSDAVNWAKANSVTTEWLEDVTFGNDTFVAVGHRDVLCSDDGISWTPLISGAPAPFLYKIVYGDGRFVAVGSTIMRAEVAQAVLSKPRLVNGVSEFLISGEKGRVYRLEAATRLSPADWADLGSVTNSAAVERFADTNTGVLPRRFYRALLNP